MAEWSSVQVAGTSTAIVPAPNVQVVGITDIKATCGNGWVADTWPPAAVAVGGREPVGDTSVAVTTHFTEELTATIAAIGVVTDHELESRSMLMKDGIMF